MKKTVFFILLFSLNACVGIDMGDCVIILHNETVHPISAFVADGLNSGYSFPDTTLPSTLNPFCLTERITDTAVIYSGRSGNYERLLSPTSQGVLSVYLFNQNVVDDDGWDSVVLTNNYLVRYDLTASDLKLLKGHIHFPPSVEMNRIKMFPPYDEFAREE